ncbi:MAG: hypothetical protein A2X12_04620 [Bacteroidetes bacterium GWE2_29_8]|nr:MAG: hypothetical protein A2X12_04620 [Bacteroidetes bacterium GWE2_29_8]
MNNNPIIKICKIDSLTFASFAIKENVDLLGVHVLKEDDIGEHKELVDFIEKNNGRSIIVTKITKLELLKKIIEFYNPSGIQLHFEVDMSLVTTLRCSFPNLIIIGVITNNSKFLQFERICELHDYIIYDSSYLGGTNKKNDYILLEHFSEKLLNKTLLAGAISKERIMEIEPSKIAGYDIQSYFRNNSELNFKNLEYLCDLVKFPRKNKLSISLTDIPLCDIHHISSYYLNAHFEYHLDISNGSLYSSFNTKNKSIEEKQKFLSQLPFSAHLFLNNEKQIQVEIEKLENKFPLNLLRIFIQYYDGLNLNRFLNSNADVKIIPSVYYKDLTSFISKSFNSPFISIVVPNSDNKENIKIFIQTYLLNRPFFDNKEVWFDRNLDIEYIKRIKEHLGDNYNFIIGKGIVNDFSKINEIHEYLLR